MPLPGLTLNDKKDAIKGVESDLKGLHSDNGVEEEVLKVLYFLMYEIMKMYSRLAAFMKDVCDTSP